MQQEIGAISAGKSRKERHKMGQDGSRWTKRGSVRDEHPSKTLRCRDRPAVLFCFVLCFLLWAGSQFVSAFFCLYEYSPFTFLFPFAPRFSLFAGQGWGASASPVISYGRFYLPHLLFSGYGCSAGGEFDVDDKQTVRDSLSETVAERNQRQASDKIKLVPSAVSRNVYLVFFLGLALLCNALASNAGSHVTIMYDTIEVLSRNRTPFAAEIQQTGGGG